MNIKLLLLAVGFALTTQIILAQVPSYVPTNGLVGYYAFNGNANDLSGNGNNGIVSQPTTITEDRFGNSSSAFDFGNTGSVINVPNIGSINFPNDYSISTWVYFRNFNNSYPYILCGGDLFFSLQGTGPAYGINQDKISFYATTSTSQIGSLFTSNVVSINAWHHIIIVKNSNLISLFLDGVLSSNTNYPNLQLQNSSGISFGNTSSAPISDNYKINGKIDDIGLWNRALTALEITNLYNSQTVCQSIGQDSSLLYSNGYVVGPENIIPDPGIHTETKWISVTGASVLNITTFQHRLYDSSRIYNQNNELIWQWNGVDTGEPTWYLNNHSVNVLGNDSVRIEFYQGYNGFCNGYLKVTSMDCSSLSISDNEIVDHNLFKVYPNPAHDHITIDCGDLANVSGWIIKIVNTLGQEVFSGAMNTQQYVVPLNTWGSQGIYFVKIYDASNNLVNTKKIILQ